MVRRKKVRLLLVGILLVLLTAAAFAVGDRIRIGLWKKDILSGDKDVSCKALYRVAQEREPGALEEVYSVLSEAEDRQVLEYAGYAAMRLGDAGGIDLLRHRADTGPDDVVRARLIYYAARLSRPVDLSLLDWMEGGVTSDEPWRRAGCLLGLVELGQPQWGLGLIEYASESDGPIRGFLLEQFKRIAGPMAETIGRGIDWPGGEIAPGDEAKWSSVRKFWESYATKKLLNDVLRRLEIRDPKWYEVNRLLHARDRMAGILK